MSFRELLDGLYPSSFPQVLGFIELRCRRPDGTVEQRWCGSIEEAVDTAETLQHVADITRTSVYYGVNPRSQRSGTNESVVHVIAVAADVDFSKQQRQYKNAEDYLKDFGIYPSAIVHTGHGVHPYWFLDLPVESSPEFKEVRRDFIKLGNSDAVQDEARVLRVPGSRNYKDAEPTVIEVLTLNPNRRYPGTIFQKVVRLSPKVRRVLFTGETAGYRSRSERDWAIVREMVECGFNDDEIILCFQYSKANVRYMERWPTLLRYDIERARETVSLGDGSEGVVEITESNNCYFRRIEGGTRKLSTFVLEPIALMQGDTTEEDRILCHVTAEGSGHQWKDIQFPRSAFLDKRSLVRHMHVAAWSWLGSDTELTHLLPYLMRRIQSADVPMVRTVKALGRYGTSWITTDGVISGTTVRSFSEAGYMYLEKNQVKPVLDLTIDEGAENLRKLSRILPDLNKPQVVWPALGWLFASFYKPVLHPQGRMFPILQMIGSRGAGKTSLVRNVLLPLVGYDPPEGYSCDTTDFVLLTLLGFSTSTPVFFGEYRNSLPTADRFLRRLRLSYDSGTDARGRGDQSTVAYPLVAPIVLDGENPADEPAILERSVVVNMSQEFLTDERREAYEHALSLAPFRVAGQIVQFSLNHEPRVEEAQRTLAVAFKGRTMPDRVVSNFQTVVVGLLAYRDFCRASNAFSPDFTPAFVRVVLEDCLGQVTLGDTGRTRILVDDFVEDLINHIAKGGGGATVPGDGISGTHPFPWRYDRRVNQLSFQLSGALNWWSAFRRQRGMPTLTIPTAHMQLRERAFRASEGLNNTGQYMTSYMTKYVAGMGAIQMYTVSVQGAKEADLDVPEKMELLTGFTVKVGQN